MSCVAPMSLPHFTTQDYTYQGHTFPKVKCRKSNNVQCECTFLKIVLTYNNVTWQGATVHANIGFIMKDPNNFKNPHVFNPSRFIDESGGFIKDDRVVPFSLGEIEYTSSIACRAVLSYCLTSTLDLNIPTSWYGLISKSTYFVK